MAVAANTVKTKSKAFTKMPGLSKTSRWILAMGAFLAIFFLLFTLGNNEKARTESLQKTLQEDVAKVNTPAQDISMLQDTLVKEQLLYRNAQAQFPGVESTVASVDGFMKLASACGIKVVASAMTTGTATVQQGSATSTFDCHNYVLGLSGEAARIQNFILGLSEFPTTIITAITLTPSGTESDMDLAIITVSIVLKGK